MQATKRAMSHIRRVLWRNGRPPDEVLPESADAQVLEDNMGMASPSEDQPGVPDASRGDWDHQPATQRQLRYISVLGGDLSGAGSKREASDRIKRLLSMRGRRPLDPERLAQRGARAGVETNGEWKSAHHSLLASLRLDLQEYVDLSLGDLRAKLSDPLGPGGSSQSRGPDEMVRRAEEELKQLELCRKWGQPLVSTKDQELEREGPSPPPIRSNDGSGVPLTRWLSLFAVVAVLVVIEAAANIGLLMDALQGGALAAFLLAVLVSLVNVGGLGVSAGIFLSWLRREFGETSRWLYQAAWGCWMASAFAFNLVAGRHREAYARVIEQIRENPTAPVPAARDLLSEISFNPLTWEFQALLFALLGMILCALGFAKGFTFTPGQADDPRADGQGIEGDEAPTPHERQLFDAFVSLPQRYQGGLTKDLRGEVANWYRALDHERRNLTSLLEMLKEVQNRQACIDAAEHAFIVAHNSNYPDKIDPQSVEAHRLEKYPEPLAVTASDPQVMEEAGALVAEWKESGQAAFDERLAAANERIAAIWNNYKALVLGKPEPLISNGGPVPPATPRS